ncbi:MAG: hypothetical protein K0Q49_1048 [Haloplasmataceae bacterium]|jgi:hypothetical protein|nr:hypothetical protein [Haloplasmataceae bacterium]
MFLIFGIIFTVIGVICFIDPNGVEEWRYKTGSRLTKPSEEEAGIWAKFSAILLIGFGIFLCVKEFI